VRTQFRKTVVTRDASDVVNYAERLPDLEKLVGREQVTIVAASGGKCCSPNIRPGGPVCEQPLKNALANPLRYSENLCGDVEVLLRFDILRA